MEQIEIKPSEIKTLTVDVREAETIINFLRNENNMTVYTCDNTFITKMKKVVGRGKDWKVYIAGTIKGEPTGYYFIGPKDLLTVRADKKASTTKELTPEQKKEIGERFRKSRKNIENN